MPMKQIISLIADDLKRVDEAISTHIETDVSFISDVARYMLASGGKRIRPVLLILSARLCNYVGERVYDLSTVIEFIIPRPCCMMMSSTILICAVDSRR